MEPKIVVTPWRYLCYVGVLACEAKRYTLQHWGAAVSTALLGLLGLLAIPLWRLANTKYPAVIPPPDDAAPTIYWIVISVAAIPIVFIWGFILAPVRLHENSKSELQRVLAAKSAVRVALEDQATKGWALANTDYNTIRHHFEKWMDDIRKWITETTEIIRTKRSQWEAEKFGALKRGSHLTIPTGGPYPQYPQVHDELQSRIRTLEDTMKGLGD